MRGICLSQSEKSAALEHRDETGHNTEFSSTAMLDKTLGYLICLIKEAIEIWLHPRNFSGEGGFSLTWSWYLVPNMIKQY
jgi:hypothetical protein